LGYVIVTADWPAAGRFQVGRALLPEEYQGLWRSLEAAGVWEVAEPAPEPGEPVVTLTIARSGRERQLTLVARVAPQAAVQPQEERANRIVEAIRAIAPETPGPEQPIGATAGSEEVGDPTPAGAGTKGAAEAP
jgi:hypothetical protein